MLSNKDPLPYYDKIDWSTQSQHVFRDNLKRGSTALIREDSVSGLAVMDYSEFTATFPDPGSDSRLAPLATILRHTDSSMADNPVFWVRVVGYAYLCEQFITTHGQEMGFAARNLDVRALVAIADDEEIQKRADGQEEIFRKIVAEGL